MRLGPWPLDFTKPIQKTNNCHMFPLYFFSNSKECTIILNHFRAGQYAELPLELLTNRNWLLNFCFWEYIREPDLRQLTTTESDNQTEDVAQSVQHLPQMKHGSCGFLPTQEIPASRLNPKGILPNIF